MYLVVLIAMILCISLRHITVKMTSYLEVRFYVLGSTYRDDFIHFFTSYHGQNDQLFGGTILCTW